MLKNSVFLLALGAMTGCLVTPEEMPEAEAQDAEVSEAHHELQRLEPLQTEVIDETELDVVDTEEDSVVCDNDKGFGGGDSFINSAGDSRYIRSSEHYVKLYMSCAALLYNAPWYGFQNENEPDFPKSCGPVAGMNLFEWYGA